MRTRGSTTATCRRSGDREGAKSQLRQYQQGIAQGGPIIKNKAFFFFNYEESGAQLRDAAAQRADARRGGRHLQLQRERFGAAGQPAAAAAANGQLATLDPTVAKLFGDIRSATATTGSLVPLSNPLVQQYTFQTPTNNFNPAPTVRIDYDLSQRHRLTGSMNYRHVNSTPDTTNNAHVPFPGFRRRQPAVDAVYDVRVAAIHAGVQPGERIPCRRDRRLHALLARALPSLWTGTGFGNTNGYRPNLFGACCGTGFALTNPNTGNTATNGGAANGSSREASTFVVENTATWIAAGTT